jgi:hypothetical protein
MNLFEEIHNQVTLWPDNMKPQEFCARVLGLIIDYHPLMFLKRYPFRGKMPAGQTISGWYSEDGELVFPDANPEVTCLTVAGLNIFLDESGTAQVSATNEKMKQLQKGII